MHGWLKQRHGDGKGTFSSAGCGTENGVAHNDGAAAAAKRLTRLTVHHCNAELSRHLLQRRKRWPWPWTQTTHPIRVQQCSITHDDSGVPGGGLSPVPSPSPSSLAPQSADAGCRRTFAPSWAHANTEKRDDTTATTWTHPSPHHSALPPLHFCRHPCFPRMSVTVTTMTMTYATITIMTTTTPRVSQCQIPPKTHGHWKWHVRPRLPVQSCRS